jgi:hypothetical protein
MVAEVTPSGIANLQWRFWILYLGSNLRELYSNHVFLLPGDR